MYLVIRRHIELPFSGLLFLLDGHPHSKRKCRKMDTLHKRTYNTVASGTWQCRQLHGNIIRLLSSTRLDHKDQKSPVIITEAEVISYIYHSLKQFNENIMLAWKRSNNLLLMTIILVSAITIATRCQSFLQVNIDVKSSSSLHLLEDFSVHNHA